MSDSPRHPIEPHKRPAYEPAAALATLPEPVPDMKRPASITAGAVLGLLRVVSGVLVLVALIFDRTQWAATLSDITDGADLSQDEAGVGLTFYVAFTVIGLLIQLVLCVLILRGSNPARVIVMIFSVISITSAFIGWWSEGQEITLRGTLVSLALDILILLALSSRSAAAYARRKERRHG